MASYFALIGSLGVVTQVIVAEPSVIASGIYGDPSNFVRTYIDGSKRGRYAGRGMTFDALSDTFVVSVPAGSMSPTILPNDDRIEVSDSVAPSEKSSSRLYFVRPITDAVNFRYVNPDARVRFTTTAATVEMTFRFTKLTTHGAYRSTAEVLVDGASYSTFNAANDSSNSDPPSTVVTTLSFGAAGSRNIDVIWPSGDSMDFLGMRLSRGSSMTSSPPRPSAKICLLGDSITQGLALTKPTQNWTYRLGVLKGRQVINLGYGGRTAVSSDGSSVAGTECGSVFYMIGTNDFIGQIAIGTFRANVLGALRGIREALPDARIYASGPMFMTTTLPIPASSYRSAVSAAVASFADQNTAYVDGLSLMANNSNRLSDGTHPNDSGSAEIAAALSAIIQ